MTKLLEIIVTAVSAAIARTVAAFALSRSVPTWLRRQTLGKTWILLVVGYAMALCLAFLLKRQLELVWGNRANLIYLFVSIFIVWEVAEKAYRLYIERWVETSGEPVLHLRSRSGNGPGAQLPPWLFSRLDKKHKVIPLPIPVPVHADPLRVPLDLLEELDKKVEHTDQVIRGHSEDDSEDPNPLRSRLRSEGQQREAERSRLYVVVDWFQASLRPQDDTKLEAFRQLVSTPKSGVMFLLVDQLGSRAPVSWPRWVGTNSKTIRRFADLFPSVRRAGLPWAVCALFFLFWVFLGTLPNRSDDELLRLQGWHVDKDANEHAVAISRTTGTAIPSESLRILGRYKEPFVLLLEFNTNVELPPLTGLHNLRFLVLKGKGVRALPLMHDLPNLKKVELNRTSVSEIDGLKDLSTIEWLFMRDTQVPNLSPIRSLKNLRWLKLEHRAATDLTGLSGLVGLNKLAITDSGVDNVKELEGLTALKELDLSGTGVTSLWHLRKLCSLEHLILSYTLVSTVDDLRNLSKLKTLRLVRTKIDDVRPLQALRNLEMLEVSDAGLTGLSDLPQSQLQVIIPHVGGGQTVIYPGGNAPRSGALISLSGGDGASNNSCGETAAASSREAPPPCCTAKSPAKP